MRNAQELAELIKSLAKSQKKSVSLVLQECGLNKNALFTMQSNGFFPRAEAIYKISDYLNVSIDYLLGKTDSSQHVIQPETALNFNEKKMLDIFGKLTETEQLRLIIHMTDYIADKEKNKSSLEDY